MTIELYHTAHSTCSQKVRMCLAEKGMPHPDKDWTANEIYLTWCRFRRGKWQLYRRIRRQKALIGFQQKVVNIIKEEMTSVVSSDLHSFSIPLTVDINFGKNWGILH